MIAKLMIGVSNMFIKYTFGSPLQEHVYKLEDTATTNDVINLGRYLVTHAGIPDRDSFMFGLVDGFNDIAEKAPDIKPIDLGLTGKELESMIVKVI